MYFENIILNFPGVVSIISQSAIVKFWLSKDNKLCCNNYENIFKKDTSKTKLIYYIVLTGSMTGIFFKS